MGKHHHVSPPVCDYTPFCPSLQVRSLLLKRVFIFIDRSKLTCYYMFVAESACICKREYRKPLRSAGAAGNRKKHTEMTEQDKRRLAEMEAAQARAGQSNAEFERDVVATVAVNEAVHRAVAEDATTDAKLRANQAESRERSMATSASLSRQDASNERAAASNAIFSATLIGVVAVCLVLVIGYFAW